jgi:putative DNA primase/helicase
MTNNNSCTGITAYKAPDYKALNERALLHMDDVLHHLDLEGGKMVGKRFFALNPHRNDHEPNSFSIDTETGLWGDFATELRGGDVTSYWKFVKGFKYQPEAALDLEAFLDELERPNPTPPTPGLGKDTSASLPNVLATIKPAKKPVMSGVTVIMPVPTNAPPQPKSHFELGDPTGSWRYVNEQGQLLGYIKRFDKEDGKKEFRPLTLCINPFTKRYEWRWKGFPEPRPLYGLDLMASRPDAEVVFCEGEKSADAARNLLPGCVVTTTMHGAESPAKTDFSPLAGRTVAIWPDNDQPGKEYADSLVKLLRAVEPEMPVRVIKPLKLMPGVAGDGKAMLQPRQELPEKWDAADAVADGWTAEHMAMVWADPAMFTVVPVAKPGEEANHLALISQPGVTSPVAQCSHDRVQRMATRLKNFIAARFSGGLVFTNQAFYGYTQGYFKLLDETAGVAHEVYDYWSETASEEEIEKITSGKIEEVVKMLKIIYARDISEMAPNKSLICLNNGTLDTDTYELLEHSPVHRLMVKTNIDWIPTAKCPRWLQFMDEVFEFDIDKNEKIAFMQEWFGYCLVQDCSMQRFLWLVGEGGNGKGIVEEVLTKLVGEANVSHAHLDRLNEPYVRAELSGKLINFSSEMSANSTVSDGYFKSIVGGDKTEAAKKYGASFTFTPYVRMIAATNHLPRLLDSSDGFARRAVILTFNRQFKGANKDSKLKDKLFAELPGILVWAVGGLKDLRKRDDFNVPQSSNAVLAQYRLESDPVALFADECLEQSDTDRMTPAVIFTGFNEWARTNNYRLMSNINFGRRLGALGFKDCKSGGQKYWKATRKAGSPVYMASSSTVPQSLQQSEATQALARKYSVD